MKVCHIIWDLGQGGAQRYLLDLLTQLSECDDVDCSILVLTKRGPLSDRVESLGYSVYYAGLKNGFDLFGLLRVYMRLRRESPKLIHSHSNCVAVAVLLKQLAMPVVYTEHGGSLLGNLRHDRLIYRYLHSPVRRFVAISNEISRAIVAANPVVAARVEVVHNGVDIRHIDASPPIDAAEAPQQWCQAQYRVGIVGRLVPGKGIHTFLQAAKHIEQRCPDVVFAIIGDGPLRQRLEDQAAGLGIASKTLFLGYRPDAVRFVKTFHVFMMTSEFEGFGLVAAEAMACSVPVVATTKGSAIGELLNDGEQGFLVDRRDPLVIADRVVTLLVEPQLRAAYGRGARARVMERFTIARNAAQIVRIYRSCEPSR